MGAKAMTIGLGGLVFAIFLFLKLAGIGIVATWSWWWVTSPLWIGLAIWAVLMVLAGAMAILFKVWTR
jgi:hypothetical protein